MKDKNPLSKLSKWLIEHAFWPFDEISDSNTILLSFFLNTLVLGLILISHNTENALIWFYAVNIGVPFVIFVIGVITAIIKNKKKEEFTWPLSWCWMWWLGLIFSSLLLIFIFWLCKKLE